MSWNVFIQSCIEIQTCSWPSWSLCVGPRGRQGLFVINISVEVGLSFQFCDVSYLFDRIDFYKFFPCLRLWALFLKRLLKYRILVNFLWANRYNLSHFIILYVKNNLLTLIFSFVDFGQNLKNIILGFLFSHLLWPLRPLCGNNFKSFLLDQMFFKFGELEIILVGALNDDIALGLTPLGWNGFHRVNA